MKANTQSISTNPSNQVYNNIDWDQVQIFDSATQQSVYSPTNSSSSQNSFDAAREHIKTQKELQRTYNKSKYQSSNAIASQVPSIYVTNPEGILKHSKPLQKSEKTVAIIDTVICNNPIPKQFIQTTTVPATLQLTPHQIKQTTSSCQISQLQHTNTQLLQNYGDLYKKFINLQNEQLNSNAIQQIQVVDEDKFSNFLSQRIHQICSFQLQTALSRLKSIVPSVSPILTSLYK